MLWCSFENKYIKIPPALLMREPPYKWYTVYYSKFCYFAFIDVNKG